MYLRLHGVLGHVSCITWCALLYLTSHAVLYLVSDVTCCAVSHVSYLTSYVTWCAWGYMPCMPCMLSTKPSQPNHHNQTIKTNIHPGARHAPIRVPSRSNRIFPRCSEYGTTFLHIHGLTHQTGGYGLGRWRTFDMACMTCCMSCHSTWCNYDMLHVMLHVIALGTCCMS